jgi:hypothetical protein
MKKQLIRLMYIAFMVITVNFTNATLNTYAKTNATADENLIIETKQEVRVWRYRKHKGKYQKRLWSESYGVWLSEWEDCKKPKNKTIMN